MFLVHKSRKLSPLGTQRWINIKSMLIVYSMLFQRCGLLGGCLYLDCGIAIIREKTYFQYYSFFADSNTSSLIF